MNKLVNFLSNNITTMIIRCVTLLCVLFAIQHICSAQQQYRIVYNVLEDREKDNYEIYSMNMDGTDKKNITNTPGVEWVYYAYKDKVYYVSDKDTCHRCYFLYEMDANGNDKRKITNLQLEDSWMGSRKNGAEMIVAGRVGKLRQQLYIINMKDGNYKQILADTVSYKADPMFLPDGRIVLRYRPDRKLRLTVPAELWVMDEEGNNKKQLTSFPKSDTTTPWFEYHAGPPQYNSKYNFISYLSRQNKQTQIYVTTTDGKSPSQITSGNLSSGWHSWSSDGEWLALDKSSHEGKGFDIYLVNFKTKKEIRLTDSDKTEQAPVIVEVKK